MVQSSGPFSKKQLNSMLAKGVNNPKLRVKIVKLIETHPNASCEEPILYSQQ